MILIVGLGNPGKKYEKTRHNAGFMTIDAIAANFQFPIFKLQSIFNAEISKGEIDGKEVTLAKPQTFMNKSWIAVKDIYKKYNIQNIKDLIVIHDDIDLPLGKIRISQGSSAGGHKGVFPIIRTLGTNKFIRLRIGTSPEAGKPEDVESFVLEDFTKTEEKILEEVIEKSAKAIEFFLKEGLEKAMNEFN